MILILMLMLAPSCTGDVGKTSLIYIVLIVAIMRANFDISNSDISNPCEILLFSNSLSQSKMLFMVAGTLFISPNYPKCKLIRTSGYSNL